MRLAPKKLKTLCRQKGLGLKEVLRRARVSPTAYYSLLRNDTVLPKSVHALADFLGVKPTALLIEEGSTLRQIKATLRECNRILKKHRRADRENVLHTLLLLQEPPVKRLRRSLLRGQANDLLRQ